MGTNRFIMLKKTHLYFLFGFMHGFLYRIMFPVVDSIWGFLSKFIICVFISIIGYFFRFPTNRYLEVNDSGACLDSNFDELKESESSDQGNREAENSGLVASSSKYEFLYRKGISGFVKEPKIESYTVHAFCMGSNDYANCNGRILVSRDSADGDIGKFEVEVEDVIEKKAEDPVESFIGEKVLENSVEETVVNGRKTEKPVEEKAEDSIESFIAEKNSEKTKAGFENKTEESVLRFFFEKSFEKQIKEGHSVEANVAVEDKADDSVGSSTVESSFEKPELAIEAEDSVENSSVEKFSEKPKQEIETEDIFEEKAKESVENCITEKILEKHACDMEGNDHVEEKLGDFFGSPVIDICLEKWHQEKEESDEDGEKFRPRSKVEVESITYEVLANRLDLRPESYQLTDGLKVENMEQEIHERNTSVSDPEAAIIKGLISDSDDEFIELEPQSEKLCVMGETHSGEDLRTEDKDGDEDFNHKETESVVSPDKTKEPTLQEEFISSYEEQEDDSEHYGLIERLRMELKMARTGGLPTILEESESPKIVEELGPLHIDEKHDHKDHIAEIQKVYKSYSDKMRKLDILNSQTMHAISLLQLKDIPVRLSSTFGKSSAPAIKSLLSQNLWPFKQRKVEADPATKLIRDLLKDFETVYVGQVCLSWEMLHWQYGKVKMLLECDSHGIHQYNQVAGEFQHFQVLVQRFLEDEPFQARPRVENYVKNRCALRHLLQVPVIKDDCSKYMEDAMSSEMLTDIIEESMQVFWEFLRADKDEANATSKTPQQAQVAPHDPIDLELLMDVRTDLQKKEKRLKEIQRSTNCIIKKYQRQHRGNLLDHALFIAQVELKLVSRVLNMLRITTDQLVWCHEKLQRINFCSRKIEIEPSFTLFPC
ncbi:uncharacterized protein LOC111318346 [Durio zibethinus]|uniref:Uncharacterized protein LOC111318346 n=1 Tax=Durio zibethinus TaxID=66656 RepID=A0A6P6BII6_DURZI|nr:uncharacterized protein LOC111318346 [Durio zibethinus]